ncbi:MAG: hypothetical protein IBX72_00805 [Nitrospirae bacterium]|nr:hypothetical protein [Nitrospirota bacterium]
MKQRAKSKEVGAKETLLPFRLTLLRGRWGINEKGIALAMVLVLSFIALAIMAGLIYMITSGTQISGLQKRYATSLEAGKGGADIIYQVIAARMDDPTQIENEFSFLNTFNIAISQACINDKLLRSTIDWGVGCDNLMTTGPDSHDMFFDIGASPTYRVFSKIVDTVEGNSGGDEGLLGKGVVVSGSGEVTVVHRPYLYTIEIDAQRDVNPSERAKLSILYQY